MRVDVESHYQVYYPKVVSVESGWRMYYRAGGRRGLIVSALSQDGLNWSEEKGARIGGDSKDGKFTRIEGCDVIQNLSGNLDMFFSLAMVRFSWALSILLVSETSWSGSVLKVVHESVSFFETVSRFCRPRLQISS